MRFLFLVSGLGMGNASRTAAVIDALLNENPCAEITVGCSGRGLEFLTAYFKNRKVGVFSLAPYQWRSSRTTLLWGWLRAYLKNCVDLSRTLKKINPSVLILDSDYHFPAWLRFRKRTLYIGQAFHVVRQAKELKIKPNGLSEWCSFLFGEWLDYWFQRLTCGEIIVPSLKSAQNPPRGIYQVGLIVRDEFRNRKISAQLIESTRLAIPSGSGIAFAEFQQTAERLGFSIRKSSPGNILRAQDIDTAECLLVQGGLSSVSEALALKIPFHILPIRGRFEQRVTAESIERSNLGRGNQAFTAVDGAERAAGIINSKALTL